jgi:hypothetical protein
MLFEHAVLEPGTRTLLRRLGGILAGDRFFLVGGTALAIQIGHRRSIDHYFLLERYPIQTLLDFYRRKFPDHDVFFVIGSLAYFDDTDREPDPVMLREASWGSVKEAVANAVRTLG